MPTLVELLVATEFTITPDPIVLDMTKPIRFEGRRDEAGVTHIRFTAQTADGQLVSTPEFPMSDVPAAFGGQAAIDFVNAAGVVFPMMRVYAMGLIGATPGAPP